MAYETGSASDIADLFSKLHTFATSTVSTTWTSDENDTGNGVLAISKTTGSTECYVQFWWDEAGSPEAVGIYQSLGFINTSTDPGSHTDDSGNGYNTSGSPTNSNYRTERHVDLGSDGPFPSYHFFEDDDATTYYIHVVVEIETDVYRHFGFGILNKRGTWTGGEYCYGQEFAANTITDDDNCALLDGLAANSSQARKYATMHVEGLPNQGSSNWACVWGSETAAAPTDSSSNTKETVWGGRRTGLVPSGLGNFKAGNSDGFVPMYPLLCMYIDKTDDELIPLGTMPDVRCLNIANFEPGAEQAISGEGTWIMFPISKRAATTEGGDASGNDGVAYKKVT